MQLACQTIFFILYLGLLSLYPIFIYIFLANNKIFYSQYRPQKGPQNCGPQQKLLTQIYQVKMSQREVKKCSYFNSGYCGYRLM